MSWTAVWLALIVLLAIAVSAVTSAHVILFKRDVRAAIGWTAAVWLSPFVGPLAYGLLGINRIQRRAARLGRRDTYRLEMPADGAVERGLPEGTPGHLVALGEIVRKVTGAPLTHGNSVEPLIDGDETYPAMLEAIDGAERSIALCSYIFDHDEAGRLFVEHLVRAAERGVAVRVLIDGVGARYGKPPVTSVLARRGVPVAEFLGSFLRSPYINLRNHRKIMVVDGRIGFTGGINIRAGCLLKNDPPHAVRDLHFRIRGPLVAQMLVPFVEDWSFTTGEVLEGRAWASRSEPAGSVVARGILDGPDENFETVRWAILGALAQARRSVSIVTPYFLPDQTIVTALRVATLRGVRVSIVLPEVNNLRFVQWASTAQLWQVLEYGCEVRVTKGPFDHSKVMLVDDGWAMIGSANWDARSLRLNFEFNVECYDPPLVASLSRTVERKLRGAHSVRLAELDARPLPIKLRDGAARLLAPYL